METQKTFSDRLDENTRRLMDLMSRVGNKDLDIKSAEYKTLQKELFRESNALSKEGKQLEKEFKKIPK